MKRDINTYGRKIKTVCPICKSENFEYQSYSEDWFGVIEQHGYCDRCGYMIEQAYSPVYVCYWDIKRGFKHPNGKYYAKNVRKHRKYRKKNGVKNADVNPIWSKYI